MDEQLSPMRPVAADDYREPGNGARPRLWVRLLVTLGCVSVGVVAGMIISAALHP